jgi:hypothetical protein
VSYTVLSGPATVSGNVLTITGAGSVTVQASQAGNTLYLPATPVSRTFTVNKAGTALALTSNNNPSTLGQSVTFVATITPQDGGQASGTITFKDGSVTLGAVTVGGNVATLTVSTLAAGTQSISAIYSGDTNFTASTSAPLVQVVNKATPAIVIVSSLNPARAGQTVTFTVAVSSSAATPTGTVEFLDGAKVLAKATLSAGTAKYSTSKLPAGSNSITAVYLGDSNNNGVTSTPVSQVIQVVTTTTLAASTNPSAYGQALILTAVVTSTIGAPPAGETVIFMQGTTELGTGVLSGGTATLSISTLPVGTNSLTAVYAGDASLAASQSKAVSQNVYQASTTTTFTSSQNPSRSKQAVKFTATVTPQYTQTPTGTVTFLDGTKVLKTVSLSGGEAAFSTSTLAEGVHTITVEYNGSTSFAGSSESLTQTVNP